MKKFIPHAAMLSAILLAAPLSSAWANNSATPDEAMGTVSASASTLSEMEQAINVKTQKMGGSHYKITSARMGNRTTGTAIVYK
ncbi:hypothetical protein TUM12370_00130 [Salmonella enterica subsp. enterica serovar Choleraesuis]|nr:hypothetical protein TUM12370_00130 [Salmonella enterica subsp. enterica serovar Choleraesuis]